MTKTNWLSREQVMKRLDINRASLSNYMKSPYFPKLKTVTDPVTLIQRTVFDAEEIDAWWAASGNKPKFDNRLAMQFVSYKTIEESI